MFHKFERLRVALSEGGIGWMPWLLERTDYTWERHRGYTGVNTETRPSDLFRDHIFGCFIADEAGVEMRHLIGIDNIMFEGDYPHSDSNFPASRTKLEGVLAGVPDDEARKIAELNAQRTAFIADYMKKNPNAADKAFDEAVKKAIKQQAQDRGIKLPE